MTGSLGVFLAFQVLEDGARKITKYFENLNKSKLHDLDTQTEIQAYLGVDTAYKNFTGLVPEKILALLYR